MPRRQPVIETEGPADYDPTLNESRIETAPEYNEARDDPAHYRKNGARKKSKPVKGGQHKTASARVQEPATTAPMLPPENPIEVAEPGTSGETVNQRRLREFYELQQEFYDLRDKYIARYSQIQDLILHGALIQQGQYKVQYGVRMVRRPRYKQVVIDLKGEQYQQRVLENTAPHAHFRVRVE